VAQIQADADSELPRHWNPQRAVHRAHPQSCRTGLRTSAPGHLAVVGWSSARPVSRQRRTARPRGATTEHRSLGTQSQVELYLIAFASVPTISIWTTSRRHPEIGCRLRRYHQHCGPERLSHRSTLELARTRKIKRLGRAIEVQAATTGHFAWSWRGPLDVGELLTMAVSR
jgi:hypothetical protein